MAKITIEKLDRDVKEGEFNCGNPSINMQIQESYYPTLLQYAYAYRISLEGTTVGYYMIKFRTIKFESTPSELSDYNCSLLTECSAMHIKYIAIDEKYQKMDIGTNVLKIIILTTLKLCRDFPITLITVDALVDKYEWYRKNGFVAFDEEELNSPGSTIQMYINCILDKETVKDYCSV